ncbi:MAG: TerB family tellurite resistance protein [Thermoleophilia bacterium]|nr:TerB family tellurite resistance protein [Thermoleophilia bacterium]
MHAPRRIHQRDEPFRFHPDRDSILPVDDGWLVDPRMLAQRADPHGHLSYEQAYAEAVDELARSGYGCVPDPTAGDAGPQDLVATCIVYEAEPAEHVRESTDNRELHLRLVCAMARIDGAFVGSELGVALEVADRLAGDCPGRRKRYRALVRELFISPTALPDPVSQLAALPRHEALDVVESLKAMAWADGLLRAAEHRMLCLVHDALDLPRELVGALRCSPRYVDPLAA